MGSISKKYSIQAPAQKVWECLTDAKRIEQWSGSRCKMTNVEGSEFSLWDGDIWGKNTKIVTNKELVQEWYAGKWDHPSFVRFELDENNGVSILKLTHTDIPENEVKDIDFGWDAYYLEPLKLVAESI